LARLRSRSCSGEGCVVGPGRQLGRDAMGRREVLGDPFALMRAGFGSRQLTHAPMRAAQPQRF